MNFVK